jgi:hypothetical protein
VNRMAVKKEAHNRASMAIDLARGRRQEKMRDVFSEPFSGVHGYRTTFISRYR